MVWNCPICNKSFRNKNQEHSCEVVPVEMHLRNKAPHVHAIYYRILEHIDTFGPFTLNPVKTVVQVKNGATFLSIKPKRESVQLEFQMSDPVAHPRIEKSFQISRNRVLHFLELRHPDEVDDVLISWLRKAYILTAHGRSQ